MKLYGYWRSSASWRVRIALEWKGLSFENVPVHLVKDGGEQLKNDHTARNPLAQVPVLEVGGEQLSQSLAILEYLEEAHPTPALLPEDKIARARVRQLAEVVNSGIQPLQNLFVLLKVRDEFKQDHTEWAAFFIKRGLDALEKMAQQTAGTFLVGDAVSLADLCLVPQLYNARRFKLDVEALWPTLARVEASCNALEAFQAAHPDRQIDAQVQA